MIKCNGWPVGICTWSIGDNLENLARIKERLDVEHLHLHAGPALEDNGSDFLVAIQQQGWTITSTAILWPQEDYSSLDSLKATGGIVPDQYWQENRKTAFDAIDITAELAVKYLSFHLGFLDLTDRGCAGKLYDRVKTLADRAAEKNVQLLMETGQEFAAELRQFLEELNHPALGVNFDPANMILYDKGSPIEAVQTLAGWIKHIHIKDAIRTEVPGMWGEEVVWDTGQVGSTEFLKTLKKIGFTGALAIEREAGDNRLGDIKTAVDALVGFAG